MNCHDSRATIVELARSCAAAPPGLASHLDRCAECAEFFDAQRELQATLRSIADEATLAPDLESRLLAEFDAAPRRTRWWIPVSASAAAATLAAAVILLRVPQPHALPHVEQQFLRVPYVVPPAPYERTEVVRMDVPLAALIAAGLEVHVADSGAAVQADVLVGQDGRALAIRLIPNSDPERTLNR